MLTITDHDAIREIRLDRPPVNAFNTEFVTAIMQALDSAFEDSKAVILSGRPGMFSGGLDVPELLQLDREGMKSFWRAYFGLLEQIARAPVPVVAALTGHSPAGGAVISLYCDYRVMSRGDFVFGLNETQVGLMVPRVIQQALIRLIGPHEAERAIVAGALLSPEKAYDCGMVDALAENPDHAVAIALEWCHQLLALPQHAMSGNRQMLREDLCACFDDLGEADVTAFVDGWFAADTQKTLKALIAKLKAKT